MKHDAIELDGVLWRVEFNWNAISEYLEANNMDLSAIDDLKTMKPKQITELVYYGLVEGARLEGKEFPYSVKDLSLSVRDVTALLVIFSRHVNVTNTHDVAKKKEKLFSLKK